MSRIVAHSWPEFGGSQALPKTEKHVPLKHWSSQAMSFCLSLLEKRVDLNSLKLSDLSLERDRNCVCASRRQMCEEHGPSGSITV